MSDFLVLFAAVFFLNTLPAFAPPTWMALSYAGFRQPLASVAFLALVGAAAATLGRMALAKLARVIVRQKVVGEATRKNVDVLKHWLEKSRTLSFGLCLFYAFSPLPSNFLFIAYGMTSLKLSLVAVPFFLGRFIGYNFWVFAGSLAARKILAGSPDGQSYLGFYFVFAQIGMLALIYLFAKVDWKSLLDDKKLRWMKADGPIPLGSVKPLNPK